MSTKEALNKPIQIGKKIVVQPSMSIHHLIEAIKSLLEINVFDVQSVMFFNNTDGAQIYTVSQLLESVDAEQHLRRGNLRATFMNESDTLPTFLTLVDIVQHRKSVTISLPKSISWDMLLKIIKEKLGISTKLVKRLALIADGERLNSITQLAGLVGGQN